MQATLEKEIIRAAKAIKNATILVFTAGAGLGVDSGLPDFRGPEGFWRAYPPMKHLNLRFEEMSTPHWFKDDPRFAWGFWAHRFGLYKNAQPHEGYHVLKRFSEKVKNYFIFTSNVDGAFERIFPKVKIIECHGSVHYMQCLDSCNGIWAIDSLGNIEVDKNTFRAIGDLPTCKKCGGLARPNVLMFGDWSWDSSRCDEQEERYTQFLNSIQKDDKVVIIEIGAGENVPTVRITSENIAREYDGTLIRINPRDYKVPKGNHISLPMGGKDALVSIENELKKLEK